MMAQLRRRYPPDWEQLAYACKEYAGWKCQHCHVEQFTVKLSARGTPYMIYLHAAHAHHDPANPQPELLALCVSCHARYDSEHRQRKQRIALERRKHQREITKRYDLRWYGG